MDSKLIQQYKNFDPILRALETAKEIVKVLKSLGLDSCIVGGLACYLYGNTRAPNVIAFFEFLGATLII